MSGFLAAPEPGSINYNWPIFRAIMVREVYFVNTQQKKAESSDLWHIFIRVEFDTGCRTMGTPTCSGTVHIRRHYWAICFRPTFQEEKEKSFEKCFIFIGVLRTVSGPHGSRFLHRLGGEKFNKWSNIIPGARSSPALPNDTYLFLVPESTPPGQNTRNNITFHWLHKFKFMIMVNSVLPAARTHLPLLSKFRPLLRKTRVVGPARSSIICVL